MLLSLGLDTTEFMKTMNGNDQLSPFSNIHHLNLLQAQTHSTKPSFSGQKARKNEGF